MAELKHFGVKGMKWGVRKQRELDRANRVAGGTASKGEKIGLLLNTSLGELAVNKGSLRRVAKGKAFILQAQKERIESGKVTVGDRIDRIMNDSYLNLVRGR